MANDYGLSFIANEQIYQHVKETIDKYRFKINLKEFNKNLVDPIKLTFDAKVYGKSIQEIIESESLRQIDKSNTNHIGYFHQNIFKYFDGWQVPKKGYDVINNERRIFVEMKNKHNTMNSSSSQKTYMKMQSTIIRDDSATCYLVEAIAKDSQDIAWRVSLNGESFVNKNIRRMSIDKFYALVTGKATAFKELCEVLPQVIDDVIASHTSHHIENSVFDELNELSSDLVKSIYLLSFKNYEGFSSLRIK
ncbi:MAG: Eco47II family restriction endonuclease [Psychrobium sp.]|nr:Eco47II family restriction endonuclease [Psychrobium sp.]